MSSIAFAYLGKAGAMRQIPIPRRGFDSSPSHAETVFTLLSGGTAKVGTLNRKRTFTLPYDVASADSDVLLGFYEGIYGTGPWRFVDPTARNMLDLDVSTCGARPQASPGWVASAGTLTTGSGGPAGVDSGVLTWGSLVASATLQPGTVANTAPLASSPVYLPLEAVTVSLWAKASAATTASLQLTGYNSAGAVLVTSAATSMSLTTAWQRFTVTIPIGAAAFASAFYVLPTVVLGATVPTTVSIAGAQLEYGDTMTAWQLGYGCPQVTISGSPGRQASVPGWRAHTLTLGEV